MTTTPVGGRVTTGGGAVPAPKWGRIRAASVAETKTVPPALRILPTGPMGLPLTKKRPSLWVKISTVLVAFLRIMNVSVRSSTRRPSREARSSTEIVSSSRTTLGAGPPGPRHPVVIHPSSNSPTNSFVRKVISVFIGNRAVRCLDFLRLFSKVLLRRSRCGSRILMAVATLPRSRGKALRAAPVGGLPRNRRGGS